MLVKTEQGVSRRWHRVKSKARSHWHLSGEGLCGKSVFGGVRVVAVSLWGEKGKGMGKMAGIWHSLLKSLFSIMSFTLCPGQRQNITWHASLSPPIKPFLLTLPGFFLQSPWFLNSPLKRLGAFLRLPPSAQGVSHLLPEKLLY